MSKPLEWVPGKASREIRGNRTKTDTGRWEENSKALEITYVKELDRLVP
jgi:hypothetical protein